MPVGNVVKTQANSLEKLLRPSLVRDIETRIIDQIITIMGCDYHINPLAINQILKEIIDYIP